jgi:hypothetical protein
MGAYGIVKRAHVLGAFTAEEQDEVERLDARRGRSAA